MKKLNFILITLLGILMVFNLGCWLGFGKKDDDKKNKDKQTLLLGWYLLDQASGNCAIVEKYDDDNDGQYTYMANLYPIPKSDCNINSYFGGTDFESIKNKNLQNINDAIDLINREFSSDCSDTKKYLSENKEFLANYSAEEIYTAINGKEIKLIVIENLVEEVKHFLKDYYYGDDLEKDEDTSEIVPASYDEYKRYFELIKIYDLSSHSISDSNCEEAVKRKINEKFPPDKYMAPANANVYNNDSKNKANKLLGIYCFYGDNSTTYTCKTLKDNF